MDQLERLIRMLQLAADKGDRRRVEQLLSHPDCLFLADCVRAMQEGHIGDAFAAIVDRGGHRLTEDQFNALPIEEAGFEAMELSTLERLNVRTIGEFMAMNVEQQRLKRVGVAMRTRFRLLQDEWRQNSPV